MSSIPGSMRDYKMAHKWIRVLSSCLVASFLAALSSLFMPTQAQAIPPFARKYDVNCTACHTAPPILNQFGQRFLENGYQLPGTEDGGIVGKKKLGETTLDDVTNYLGFRIVGNTTQTWSFKKQNPPGADAGVVENKTELTFPANFVLFAGGLWPKTLGLWSSWAMMSKKVGPRWSEVS
jgi:hypothetical protein